MNVKPILGATIGLQASALAIQNVKMFDKKMKVTPKRLVKQGIGNILGISMLKAQSDIINTI